MGIDVYLHWNGMTEKEKKAQITGFSTVSGHLGYLREAYHGDPYATKYLVSEAFKNKCGSAKIPAKILEGRLPVTIQLAMERERQVYEHTGVQESDPIIQSYVHFVELCKRKEKETKARCVIIASH